MLHLFHVLACFTRGGKNLQVAVFIRQHYLRFVDIAQEDTLIDEGASEIERVAVQLTGRAPKINGGRSRGNQRAVLLAASGHFRGRL